MIVTLFTFLSLVYVFHKDYRVGIASIIYIFLLLLIHIVFFYEVTAFGLDYFISDELAYIDFGSAHGLSDAAKGDRILWFYVQNIASITFSADGLFNKLVSLPLLPLILLLVTRFCNNSQLSLSLYILCPYLLFLMQTALRDVAILFLTLLIIYHWCNSKKKGLKFIFQLFILTMLLFLLRPFAVFILVFSLALYEFISNISGRSLKDKCLILFYNGFIAVLITVVFYFLFQNKIDQYIRTLTYFSENGLWLDESKSSVKPGLTIQYFTYAIVRYLSTPLPLSLLERFLTQEVTQFGYLDDIVRFFNQLFYFMMLVWILLRGILLKGRVTLNWSSSVWVLFIVTSINSFIYALYYAGGGHSRLKLLLFVFVFIVFVNLSKRKHEVI